MSCAYVLARTSCLQMVQKDGRGAWWRVEAAIIACQDCEFQPSALELLYSAVLG